MYSIAYVALDQFYVGALRASGAAEDSVPLAVCRDKRVIDACPIAHAWGVRKGMGQSEAKTLLRDRGRVALYEEEPYRPFQIAFLDRLAEFSDSIQPGNPHEAWADFSSHPDPYGTLVELARRVDGLAGGMSIGLGPSRWLAQLWSTREPLDPTEVGALEWRARMKCPEAELSDRPIDHLVILDPDIRKRLKFLGYRRVGEVAGLSSRLLKQQFGPEAWRIRETASGGLHDPVVGTYPEKRALARFEIPGGTSDLEGVNRLIERLAERIGGRLKQQDEAALDVIFTLELESGRAHELRRTFTKPIHDVQTLRVSLKLMIPQLREPLMAAKVELPRLAKIVRKQRRLDGEKELKERQLSVQTAMRSIRTVYGDSAIKVAGEIELPRRVRVLRAWSHATGWR